MATKNKTTPVKPIQESQQDSIPPVTGHEKAIEAMKDGDKYSFVAEGCRWRVKKIDGTAYFEMD